MKWGITKECYSGADLGGVGWHREVEGATCCELVVKRLWQRVAGYSCETRFGPSLLVMLHQV